MKGLLTVVTPSLSPLKRLTGWLHPAPLLAVLLWGGIYPGAKLALREISALDFTGLRIVLATAVLFAASSRARPLRLPSPLWRPLLNAGLAQTAFQGLLVAGLNRTTAGNSAILLATAPLLVAAWLALTVRDRLAHRQWCGLLAGLVGVALVVRGGGVGFGAAHLHGDLLALVAAAAWVWYGLAVGPLVGAVGTLRATAWTMAVAACVFVPTVLVAERAHLSVDMSWQAWAGLVYGATAGMVVAMALWGRSIHRLGPKQTMVYAYVEPLSAVVVAAVVLGETVSAVQLVGALVTFAGVWLAS